MNQFSDLTDSDIDMIQAVKAEMQAAKIESNELPIDNLA